MPKDTDELLLDTPLDGEIPPEAESEGDEISIEIEGEEPDAEEETPLQKKLRGEIRERDKRIKELERTSAPQDVDVGTKPTLEDFDWDADKYEAAVVAWHDRSRRVEAARTAQQQTQQAQAEAFQRAQATYRAKADSMGLQGMAEAEHAVTDALGNEYFGLIIQHANRPAELIAALGKHPRLLAHVADESDPVRRIMLLATMEAKVNVTRKKPPAAEADTIQRGSAPLSATTDKQAERLLAAAEKSGNMTEYNRYMKAKRAK